MTFDEDAARVSGLPTSAYNMAITLLTALTISAAIKIVGALMVSALITVPVASSLIAAKSFRHALFLSRALRASGRHYRTYGCGHLELGADRHHCSVANRDAHHHNHRQEGVEALMELNIWIALGAGFLSFISPCCLPLYPSYLSYITGISVGQLKEDAGKKEVRRRLLAHTLLFILGIFLLNSFQLGAAAGLIADIFAAYRELISKIAGILVAVFGLFMLGPLPDRKF